MKIKNKNRLPVSLKKIDSNHKKLVRRSKLVPLKKYEKIDFSVKQCVSPGTSSVTYVCEDALSTIFQINKPKAMSHPSFGSQTAWGVVNMVANSGYIFCSLETYDRIRDYGKVHRTSSIR